jgi:hypothetical protein
MVCTTAVYVSRVKFGGKVHMDLLEVALKMMPDVENVSRKTNCITVMTKDGRYVTVGADNDGIFMYGLGAPQVQKNVQQYYRAVAEKAALDRMGYNTQMELTENKLLRIVAVK